MENNKAVYTREQKRRLWSAQLASITGFLAIKDDTPHPNSAQPHLQAKRIIEDFKNRQG